MAQQKLLDKLVRVLVLEWGAADVRSAVDRASIEDPTDHRFARNRSRKKPTAIEQVQAAVIADDQRPKFVELARRFDSKQFMPSNYDVREFLIMSGVRPPGMKDRSQAFRQLLQVLVQLPPDKLEALARKTRYSGPAELGPLSDAISNAAGRISRYRDRDDS
jgi:hypothetical protein